MKHCPLFFLVFRDYLYDACFNILKRTTLFFLNQTLFYVLKKRNHSYTYPYLKTIIFKICERY